MDSICGLITVWLNTPTEVGLVVECKMFVVGAWGLILGVLLSIGWECYRVQFNGEIRGERVEWC